jgi:hypothetical protein
MQLSIRLRFNYIMTFANKWNVLGTTLYLPRCLWKFCLISKWYQEVQRDYYSFSHSKWNFYNPFDNMLYEDSGINDENTWNLKQFPKWALQDINLIDRF